MIVCTACTAELPARAYPKLVDSYKRDLLRAAGYPVPED